MPRVAIVGCTHGELDLLYEAVMQQQQQVDFILCCGDFEAVRNEADLATMACPQKYRKMTSFTHYYFGRKIAPVLTIFIGGNHEASNHMQELPYGGWVAPNMYYLGNTGCIWVGGIRIAGLSGIFNGRDFRKGRFEQVPYDDDALRSVFHVRRWDVEKLYLIRNPIDTFLSHDWPVNVTDPQALQASDVRHIESLLRRKPFFRKEVEEGDLGSPVSKDLLLHLRPRHWFSAHMHVMYEVTVIHSSSSSNRDPVPVSDPDALDLDDDVTQQATTTTTTTNELVGEEILLPHKPAIPSTHFLALDKVVPGAHFLKIVDIERQIPHITDNIMRYDPEWLAVLKATHDTIPMDRRGFPQGGGGLDHEHIATKMEMAKLWVIAHFGHEFHVNAKYIIPHNFVVTVPENVPWARGGRVQPARPIGNPQHDVLLNVLELQHLGTVPYDATSSG